ncbi:nucleoside phosphorylase [Fusibacillus kribbianus]|uniref:Uridine phosphorylase n=1 Tax=Fusibacillus kribbianus TaxID=3044208 RepID=A0AAP4BBY5_9FIRM|nr:nucleoside phosphorylase [Ruminococcus sp. YH-rum2234]MDI9242118.1 nucleoside phosphorylase [Ruminococcus sp. YH-rum2234]
MPINKNEYPILEFDYTATSIINPCSNKTGLFPQKLIFAFLQEEIEYFVKNHNGQEIDNFESVTKIYPIYEVEFKKEKIALCQAPAGASAAVQLMEYLIHRGATKIISTGSCGTLVDIPENKFLIPISALRDEGTSYHYLPPSREIHISSKGIDALKTALINNSIDFMQVKSWTTDGFFRETKEMVIYRKQEGCQVVEMECAALAACAEFRNVVWATLLFSADSLANCNLYQKRNWGKESVNTALLLAFDAIRLL